MGVVFSKTIQLKKGHDMGVIHRGGHNMAEVLGSPMGVKFGKKVKLTFSNCLITKPLIYEMTHIYDIITNIEQADIKNSEGWVILEVNGTGSEMDKAFQWMADQGVEVQMMLPNF